jgi:hypothetical protein
LAEKKLVQRSIFMKIVHHSILVLGCLAVMAGCHSDHPHEYGERRPDVDSLHPDDRGVQSKDLVQATDEATMDLLSLPELNDSRQRWTIVSTYMDNDTTRRHDRFDIFINSLKTKIARQGRGRVQLIEQRDRFRDLQAHELEPTGDPRHTPPGPAGIQPQFALNGRVEELPNRATSLYRFEFNLTDLRTRETVWTKDYLVKTER